MSRTFNWKIFTPALLGLSIMATASAQAPQPETGFLPLDSGITLRRMVVRSAKPKGTLILLHGFPETLYSYKEISRVARMPVGTAKCYVHRARARLRTLLEEYTPA